MLDAERSGGATCFGRVHSTSQTSAGGAVTWMNFQI